jgi:hypothetical protein
LGDSGRSTACSPVSRGIPLLRRPLRRREGGGSPVPACTYGRVGRRSRRRRQGGGGAGGGCFAVDAAFSGGGALRGSSSSCSTCRGPRPGVVLVFFVLSSDLCWRRIWRCVQDRRRGSKTAALQVRGKKVVDLWRWSQIRCSVSSGCAPGRCSIFVSRSSSSELVVAAARQRLRARGSAAPVVVVLGGDLEVEDGECKLCCSLFSLFVCSWLNSVLYFI